MKIPEFLKFLVQNTKDFEIFGIARKYKGRDGTNVGRTVDRAVDRAKADRGVEVESSRIRAGRVAPTSSHRKRLAEQGQFRVPLSTRCRLVRSVEQSRYEVVSDVVVVDGVDDSVVEEVAYLVVVVEDVGLDEVARVVQLDADVVDLVSSVTADMEVTAPSTEPFMHTDGGFP